MDRELDVIVVGAGLAGLTAARRARDAGGRVSVIEAAERVGGRLMRQQVAGVNVDGGGAWVGPTQTRVLALAEELGVATIPTWNRGKHVVRSRGRSRARGGKLPPVGPLSLADLAIAQLRLDRLARRTDRRAAELDRSTIGEGIARNVRSHEARTVLEIAVATTTGSSPDEVSLLAFLEHTRSAGGFEQLTGVEGAAQDRRLEGGAVSLCERLSVGLGEAVITGAPVTAIRQDADGVSIESAAGAFRARFAVVALDPALCGRIDFGPALPDARRRLHESWSMGSGIKFHVAYERPFWREAGFSGQLLADEGLVRVAFDATPDAGGRGVLVGFLGQALDVDPRLLEPAAREERAALIAAELAEVFGAEAADPLDYVEQDWRREPHLVGCVPAAAPGVLSDAGGDPHRPWGRVIWAGAETADRWEGHMDGAVRSGELAASLTAGTGI